MLREPNYQCHCSPLNYYVEQAKQNRLKDQLHHKNIQASIELVSLAFDVYKPKKEDEYTSEHKEKHKKKHQHTRKTHINEHFLVSIHKL